MKKIDFKKIRKPLWLTKVELYIRIFILNKIMPKWKIIVASAVALLLLVIAAGAGISAYNETHRYYYIDMDGNRGTAYKCEAYEQIGLICDKEYNGKIMVRQYWRGK